MLGLAYREFGCKHFSRWERRPLEGPSSVYVVHLYRCKPLNSRYPALVFYYSYILVIVSYIL